MSSEFYVFKEGGKDNTARRALFKAFIGLVAPDDWCFSEKDMFNIDLEQDRHYAGFRKSAGIWYRGNVRRDTCWDRRLVMWLRAKNGSYLHFYDKNGNLITNEGRPLEEAAVCTLEVVLRNTASYKTGFLLLPKYKRHQPECIGKASSWTVIAYFPFPEDSDELVRSIGDCETDQEKVIELLLANKPKHNQSSSRVSAREGDYKPSSSAPAVNKGIDNIPLGIQNKRRNIEPTDCEKQMFVKLENTDVVASASPSTSSSSYPSPVVNASALVPPVDPTYDWQSMNDDDDDDTMAKKRVREDDYFPSCSNPFDDQTAAAVPCLLCKEEKVEDTYLPQCPSEMTEDFSYNENINGMYPFTFTADYGLSSAAAGYDLFQNTDALQPSLLGFPTEQMLGCSCGDFGTTENVSTFGGFSFCD